MCIYTIEISATATLASNQNALVELRSDASSTPTTVRCSTSCGVNLTLGVTIGFTNSQRATLIYIVPPGHNVRLNTTITGTATATLVNQTEITISPELDAADFVAGFPFK